MSAEVCANDGMALGAMDAARFDCALRVPEDIPIVGFDDVSSARRPPYQLTTARQPVDKLARNVVHLMVERIGNAQLAPLKLLLPGELMVRKSARMDIAGTSILKSPAADALAPRSQPRLGACLAVTPP